MDSPAQPVDPYVETLALVERREEYKDVYTYIFHPANPVSFVAGQYAHLRVLSLPEGVRRTREISFASPPSAGDLQFTIDARSGSPYQEVLKGLKPGETIELFKIRGHMTWPATEADVVMIAGGIGITPFRSMLLDAKEKNLPVTTTLMHVANGPFLYGEELKGVAGEYLAIDRSALADTLARVISEHASAHYYVAGSPGFVSAIARELGERGITIIESDEFKGLLDD